jgi:uncharacterized protein (DUF2141 family)
MPGSTIKNNIPGIIILILIAGCAKISAPSGGPRDREPPVLVKSVPVNGAKNFKGDEVSITFNEYIDLDKITEKFMVSPPMKKKPKVIKRGKSIIVQFEEAFHDSTTYTLNFQDAIRDLNEGNVLDNYQFVFSTGPVIDSLSVTGNVYNALNLDAPEETLVLLYNELYDSAVVKHLPTYISRVRKNGYFRIDNVRAGKYRLYALKDADNSKNFNLPDEQFAFLKDTIEVSSQKDYLPVIKDTTKTTVSSVKIKTTSVKTTTSLVVKTDTVVPEGKYKLILFQPPKSAHYLTSSSRSQSYKLAYTLSLPPGSAGFGFSIPGTLPDLYKIERSKNNDSILIWLTDSALYARQLIGTLVSYPFTDTTGKVIQRQDTIIMRFLAPKTIRTRVKKPPFHVTSGLYIGSLIPGQQILFQSQTPLDIPDTSKIRLYEENGSGRAKIPFYFVMDTANSCKMIMIARLVQKKNYLFIADSGAFRNIYGDVSDSTGYKVNVRNDNTFGKLILNINNYEGPRIIQLLNKDEKLMRQTRMTKDGKVEFPYVERGQYRLRVIYDLNGDGKWTTGDFNLGLQPEPVSYYPREIEVKENWDIKNDWDISRQNIKKLKSTASKNQNRQ